MVQDPAWHLYRSLLAVIREGSLSAAARRLQLTQPTLGRHIEELEADLGKALFTRSQTGLLPTPFALNLVPFAEAMESAAAALMRTAEQGSSSSDGTVRITASEIMGSEVLPPILSALQCAHPKLVFELVLSNRNDDLLRRDADIAVRMVRPTQAALVAQRIGDIQLGFYAHRDYLARHGEPDTLQDLARFHVIGFDRTDQSARAMVKNKLSLDRRQFSFRSDSDIAQAAALRAGLGVGVMQAGIAARMPELVPVLRSTMVFSLDIWLVMHEDQSGNGPVRTAFDGLANALATWVRTQQKDAVSIGCCGGSK